MEDNKVEEQVGGDEQYQSEKEEDAQNWRIVKPKRTIVVEPILVIMILFGFPLMQVSQLYVYAQIQEYVQEKYGYNKSLLSSENSNSTNHCDENKSSIEYQFTEQVQTINTYYSMISSVVRSVPCFFSLLFLSAYSDKAGRKYAIVPPIIGGFLYVSGYLIIIFFNLPIWCFWISSFVEGLFGGMSLLFVGCFSYIADITKKEQRQFRITVMEMVPFFFGILTPIGAGYLIQKTGYFWPVLISFGGHVLNLIYVIFFVPETIRKGHPSDDNKITSSKKFAISNLGDSFKVISIETPDKRRWKLQVLLLSFFVHRFASGVYNIDSLFQLNIPLCWTAVIIGYYKTTIIGVSTIGSLVLAKLLKFCVTDAMIAVLASAFDIVHCIYLGLVKNTIMMFLCEYFHAFRYETKSY